MAATFTALDFETANYRRNSICQVGLVRFENGQIVREVSRLVRPPGNWYIDRFSELHGIDAAMTADAPDFATLWPELAHFIEGQTVVAHNGPRFDFSALRQTLAHYRVAEPAFEGVCTLSLFRRGLAELCEEYGIALDHHDALSDARACGRLFCLSRSATPMERS